MKCVIISEKKVFDLGKRCLSNLRDFVNNEYLLGFNEVKRLRTLYFLACQKVVAEKLKSKENPSFLLENPSLVNINEVWNEKLEEKFLEAFKYNKKSKVGDQSKVEEVFKSPVCDKYSKVEFSLKETARILSLVESGLKNCKELDGDLIFDIKDFENIYNVYDYCYKSLDRV